MAPTITTPSTPIPQRKLSQINSACTTTRPAVHRKKNRAMPCMRSHASGMPITPSNTTESNVQRTSDAVTFPGNQCPICSANGINSNKPMSAINRVWVNNTPAACWRVASLSANPAKRYNASTNPSPSNKVPILTNASSTSSWPYSAGDR